MTYAEYLAREAGAPTKSEFVNGVVYARSGGTLEHGALALAGELRVALAGKPCRTFSSDVRVRATSTGSTFRRRRRRPQRHHQPRRADRSALIEVQRLNSQGRWEPHFFGPGSQVELTSVAVTFPLDAVYPNPLS